MRTHQTHVAKRLMRVIYMSGWYSQGWGRGHSVENCVTHWFTGSHNRYFLSRRHTQSYTVHTHTCARTAKHTEIPQNSKLSSTFKPSEKGVQIAVFFFSPSIRNLLFVFFSPLICHCTVFPIHGWH